MLSIKNKEIKGNRKKFLNIIFVFLAIAFDAILLCVNIHFVNSTTDISKYHKNIEKFERVHTRFDSKEKLVIFPRELKNSYTINEYYYANVFQLFNHLGKHFILDITFNTEEDYKAEIERLKCWEIIHVKDNESKTMKLLYSEELFDFPAYIASYNYLYDNEYALVLSDNRIMYIYVSQNIEYAFYKKKFHLWKTNICQKIISTSWICNKMNLLIAYI